MPDAANTIDLTTDEVTLHTATGQHETVIVNSRAASAGLALLNVERLDGETWPGIAPGVQMPIVMAKGDVLKAKAETTATIDWRVARRID